MDFVQQVWTQLSMWCSSALRSSYSLLLLFSSPSKSVQFNNTNMTVYFRSDGNHSNCSSNIIGEGAYSTVFKAYDHKQRVYAIKRMILQSREMEDIASVEVTAYLRFKHPNIICLLDSVKVSEIGSISIYMLFPYLKRGSLRDHLNLVVNGKAKKLPLKVILSQFMQICDAVHLIHTHSPGFVHQDIKPENILLGDDLTPYLIDLGSVRPADITISTRKEALQLVEDSAQLCTASYRPPELYDPPSTGTTIDCSVPPSFLAFRTDVWSLGCLLFAWWFGYSPFECEFTSSSYGIRVVECTASRVLAGLPRIKSPTSDDSAVMLLVEWILSNDLKGRPQCSDIIHRIHAMHSIELSSKYENGIVNAV